MSQCECHQCIEDFDLKGGDQRVPGDFFSMLPLSTTKYIFCQLCGNKRCPKASNHRLVCTMSNEPGQDGSVYK